MGRERRAESEVQSGLDTSNTQSSLNDRHKRVKPGDLKVGGNRLQHTEAVQMGCRAGRKRPNDDSFSLGEVGKVSIYTK